MGRREHRAANTKHRSRGRAIYVLRSLIYDEGRPGERRRRRDCPWVSGLLGLILVCVLGIFFFFFFLINTSVLCVWFAEFYIWFAFVLGFDLSASDDATWWDSARRQRLDGLIGFNFWLSVFFWLRIRGLAVSELPIMGSPWAWLAMDGLGFVIYI